MQLEYSQWVTGTVASIICFVHNLSQVFFVNYLQSLVFVQRPVLSLDDIILLFIYTDQLAD